MGNGFVYKGERERAGVVFMSHKRADRKKENE